jgi:hypothetical protein
VSRSTAPSSDGLRLNGSDWAADDNISEARVDDEVLIAALTPATRFGKRRGLAGPAPRLRCERSGSPEHRGSAANAVLTTVGDIRGRSLDAGMPDQVI